ncbi:MAG: hypothetical protein KGI79_01925 [Patescibacteria group bacterium]|nr:hypothetical protein [Patescibacteria group bacterium]MDE2116610.1 hypothetical protein [Patescibacteria group bacterium]
MAKKEEGHPDHMKLLILAGLGFLAIALAWLIFAPQPEKGGAATAVGTAATGIGNLYSNETFGFDIKLPPGFTVDESYVNTELGPGKEIPGVSFTIPASLASGTNLGVDSYVSIEELDNVVCEPSDFLSVETTGEPVAIGNNLFMYATSTGVGAGNIYEESIYITQKGARCYAVRYFIHSTEIANYPPGAVRPFDRQKLLALFDSVTASLDIH